MRTRVLPATRSLLPRLAVAATLVVCAASPLSDGASSAQEPPSQIDGLMRARREAGVATTGDAAVCFAPGTSAEYVAAVPAQAEESKAFSASDSRRWSVTATDGLRSGQGTPITLTWSVVPDGTQISGAFGALNGPSDLRAYLDDIYGSESGWMPLLQRVFDRWGEVCGITSVFEPEDDGLRLGSAAGRIGKRGDIRIGGKAVDGSFGVLAYNAFPNDGDMVIDTDELFFRSLAQNSRRLRNVVSHEHGHGMGLDHVCPMTRTKLMEPAASTSFDGPQHDDILGAQRLYGDRFEPNDSTGGAELVVVTGRKLIVSDVSIDDDGDADFYAFDASEGSFADVTLRPIGKSYSSGPESAGGACSGVHPKIDTREMVDLRLALLRPDGSVFASVNATGRGQSEELIDVPLPEGAGRYFVRVRGSGENEAQLYEMTLNLALRGEKPVAFDDAAETFEVLPVEVGVLDNDSGLADDPIVVRIDVAPHEGQVKLVEDRIVYVPPRGFVGEERFTYEVSDLHGQVAFADVTVRVRESERAGAARVDTDGDRYPDEFEVRSGTAVDDASSRPGEDISAGATPLAVRRLSVTLDAKKPLRDRLAVRGTLPVNPAFSPEGQRVVVSVGGVFRAFTLDRRGRAATETKEVFRLRVKRKKGAIVPGPARFDFTVKAADLAGAFEDEALGTRRKQKKEPRAMTVFVLFDGQTYEATLPLDYSAKVGKKGKAKLARE